DRATRAARARCSASATSRRPARPHGRAASSVALVALLEPRVSVVVVAVALPEARLVLGAELDSPHPLRALPEVELRDEQPRPPAVLGLERLAVVGVGDPRLAAGDVLQREIRRVAAVARRR